jgi:hypothetical protein
MIFKFSYHFGRLDESLSYTVLLYELTQESSSGNKIIVYVSLVC